MKRGRKNKQIKRICKTCGKIIYKTPSAIKKGGGKHCDIKCRYPNIKFGKIQKRCEYCNKKFKVNLSEIRKGKGRFHTTRCYYLSRKPKTKEGHERKTSKGYILVYKPKHPLRRKNRYVFKHRLVMEKAISRYLKSSEIVHHINGIKDDNRLSNLKIVDKIGHWKKHSGEIECPFCKKVFYKT